MTGAIFHYDHTGRLDLRYCNNSPINNLPEFNFRAVSLSRASREQLAKIYESVLHGGTAASERIGLKNLLIKNFFDSVRGIYVPISPHVYLEAKLPTYTNGPSC
jgi:hypothetical protein